jgi:hypothetical protein
MPIGDGYFGSPKGTFGKYVTGPATSPLSTQFTAKPKINTEEQQRRRYKRKRETGFVGNGYTGSYPYVTGAQSSNPVQNPDAMVKRKTKPFGKAASSKNGTGSGGTAAGFIGGLGS